MSTSQIQSVGFSRPICPFTCAHVRMSSFGHIHLTFWRRKAYFNLWVLEKETWVQKMWVTCLWFTESGPDLTWNHTGSRFPLETCSGSHPDTGLTSISLHSLTLPHLGSVPTPCYPRVVVGVGRRGSEKPKELDICNKSEYELGCHPVTWAALALTFKHVLGNGSFPSPHAESLQGESEVVFSNSVICFLPKGITGRNALFAKQEL